LFANCLFRGRAIDLDLFEKIFAEASNSIEYTSLLQGQKDGSIDPFSTAERLVKHLDVNCRNKREA
jgi:hypothetical protein